MNENDRIQMEIEANEEKEMHIMARYSNLVSMRIGAKITLHDVLIDRQQDTQLMCAIVEWCDEGVDMADEWLRIKELKATAALYL